MDANFQVTITGPGGRKLHTFEHADGAWLVATPPSIRQIRERSRILHPSNRDRDNLGARLGYRRAGNAVGDRLDGNLMEIAPGVKVRGNHLSVVLDAMRGAGRTQLDVGALKRVISQLGSYITGLAALDGTDRERAETALHAEVIKRCTM